MKKNYLLFAGIIIIVNIAIFFGCHKEKGIAPDVSNTDIPAMRSYLVTVYGFSDKKIIETKTSFIVEGDIVFPKKDFWENYKHDSSGKNERHYQSLNLVTAVTIIDVNIDVAVPTAWATAYLSAMSKWNALNGRIQFNNFIGSCPAYGISVVYVSLGSDSYDIFAESSFPGTGGYPGPISQINSACTVSMSASQMLKTAVHELGHTIGFMHTDVLSDYQIYIGIPSCDTTTDPSSIMRQGLMDFYDFSACDKAAFAYLYPL